MEGKKGGLGETRSGGQGLTAKTVLRGPQTGWEREGTGPPFAFKRKNGGGARGYSQKL